jgi:hypothetical protein
MRTTRVSAFCGLIFRRIRSYKQIGALCTPGRLSRKLWCSLCLWFIKHHVFIYALGQNRLQFAYGTCIQPLCTAERNIAWPSFVVNNAKCSAWKMHSRQECLTSNGNSSSLLRSKFIQTVRKKGRMDKDHLCNILSFLNEILITVLRI